MARSSLEEEAEEGDMLEGEEVDKARERGEHRNFKYLSPRSVLIHSSPDILVPSKLRVSGALPQYLLAILL